MWYFSACLSLFLFLSFFQIVCVWHPSANPLHLRALFVLGHLLLLILFPSTSGFVMRRPVRISRRTFLDVPFIWNARSFFLTSPILIYPLSFTIRVGNPFVIVSCPSVIIQEFYSNMHEIWLFHTLFSHFCSRYTYCCHIGAYLQCATCPEGIAPWLPQLSSFANCIQRRTPVSLLWDTFILGWLSKHPLLKLCKRSKVPEYGDDICFTSLISL